MAKSAIDVLHEGGDPVDADRIPMIMDDLAETIPVLDPDANGAAVNDLFMRDSNLMMVAVVAADGYPLGLIDRQFFFSVMSGRFGRALYTKRSLRLLLQHETVSVAHTVAIADFTERLLGKGANDLYRGFIITENGYYRGAGSTLSLVRAARSQSEAAARKSTRTTEDLRHVISMISSNVEAVCEVSATIREGSIALSSRTEVQTRDLIDAAANIQEINDTVYSTAKKYRRSSLTGFVRELRCQFI